MLGQLWTSVVCYRENSQNFSKQQTLDSSKFKFDENGGKFSQRVENTAGKGEIACNEQFLLFPVFLKDL